MKNFEQLFLVVFLGFLSMSAGAQVSNFSVPSQAVQPTSGEIRADWTQRLERSFFALPGFLLFINRWPAQEETEAGISVLIDRFVFAVSEIKPSLREMLYEIAPHLKKTMSFMGYVLSHATLRNNVSELVAGRSCVERFLPELASLEETEKIASMLQAILSNSEEIVALVSKHFPEAQEAAAQFLNTLYRLVADSFEEADASDLLSVGRLLLGQLAFSGDELVLLQDATQRIDAAELVSLPQMTSVPVLHHAKTKPSMVIFCSAFLGDDEAIEQLSLPNVFPAQIFAALYDVASCTLYTDFDVVLCDKYAFADGLKGELNLEDDFVLGEPRMVLGSSVIVKKISECPVGACDASILRRVDVIAVPACAKNFTISWA
jgi:hypothetical protein